MEAIDQADANPNRFFISRRPRTGFEADQGFIAQTETKIAELPTKTLHRPGKPSFRFPPANSLPVLGLFLPRLFTRANNCCLNRIEVEVRSDVVYTPLAWRAIHQVNQNTACWPGLCKQSPGFR